MKDVVAVGLDLKPSTLVSAYSQGVFPWPCEDLPLLWHCPVKRGVLLFEDFHYSRRLKQYLTKSPWHFTVNKAFDQVIANAQDRGLEGTWITPEMKDAYRELHRLGHTHSVEVWNGKNLVGGLYGVDIAGYFAGESMFHREDNASKAAILFVIALLKQVGRTWMDIQVVTPHMTQLGACEITRKKFLSMLASATEAQRLGSGLKPFTHEGILSKEKFSYIDFSMFIENERSSAIKNTSF
jgi:leucyl/phenylalanyl-tRNA--protein transferase